ncbi:MBL fold metallo-hydrolase [Photobacterium alginatilyticum]|uniref:MBL fold metallo-hydrolase n=2 Tax=Photobacterium alginatilyticum TaxID=1775171 RepID=A0ABW9YNH1_9GAMM|nr:MBL fold metallo-hydrolase [Photobacterium alginatilyticum]
MYRTLRAIGLLCAVLAFMSDDADFVKDAVAEQSPTETPSAWYPRTEKLRPNEMFVVALGTGMPTPITRGQKSSAWYVELGNGDIFMFDVGSGSMENLFALRPEFHRVDKVFASHLHTDHVGDAAALWVGGWLSGRYTPLHIYGPSGSKPELGTAAFVEGLKKAYAWDIAGRSGILPDAGGQLIAHEFDFKQDGGVVYEKNGVKITSFPAVHVLDGSVSYRLDWKGLSFVFGGDSAPNKWFIERAKGADFVIHELFYTPEGLAKTLGWEARQATFVSSYIHTPPSGFGKIMAEVKPRLAVGYHTIRQPELDMMMIEEVRKVYDGPLVIANDLMAWSITKDQIKQREVVSSERVQAPPTTQAYKEAKRSGEAKYSEFINNGKWKGYTPPPLPEK